MEKHIEADTVQSNWHITLRDVTEDDNTIIIEQDGEPIAALLPIHAYKHLHRTHEITDSLDTYRNTPRRTEIRDELAD